MHQPMIIACTGHVEEKWIKKAWDHQIDEVIAKPVNIDNLKIVLEEIIDYQISKNDVI